MTTPSSFFACLYCFVEQHRRYVLPQDGLPVGLQLVGRPHGDVELLGTALLLEQALGFDRCVPLEI
jgi:hypothetical protein